MDIPFPRLNVRNLIDACQNDDSTMRALAVRARDDPGAFGSLYDHFFVRVYNYARYRVDDAQTADDVTAQIFERVFRHLDTYRPEQGAFEPWLFAIARRVISNDRRAQRRRRWLPWEALHTHPSETPLPETALEEHDQNVKLLHAVAALDPRERDVIALRFGLGLSNREIATLAALSDSNVGVILYRALRKLRAQLQSSERGFSDEQ